MKKRLQLEILPQPDDVTCGPTCLHAVYCYYGNDVPLSAVVESVPQIKGGGTLAVLLGCDALMRGYAATIYTYNLLICDPTWFVPVRQDLVAKLSAQIKVRRSPRLRVACQAYLRFLELGGQVEMVDLTAGLLRQHLDRDEPIIAGLSSTWLYRAMRERFHTTIDDDLHGVPGGHFMVISGYDRQERTVQVADPYKQNPLSGANLYSVSIDRLVCAILLGIVTYDANLLIVKPKGKRAIVPATGTAGQP